MIFYSKESINDYSEDNLTVNRIEMEGYLRCLITTVGIRNVAFNLLSKCLPAYRPCFLCCVS